MKLCKDCVHVRPENSIFFIFTRLRWEYAKCARVKFERVHVVDGACKKKPSFCTVERDFDCGVQAKFFKPKLEAGSK